MRYITKQFTQKHILDKDSYDNENYKGATFGYDRLGKVMRGYKLASLRGIYNNNGLIEDVRFGIVSTYDFKLSEEMLKTTSCFHKGDILLMDRGFTSREMIQKMDKNTLVNVYQ